MRISILQIKIVHTIILWILSVCVAYVLFCGIADRVTHWTWVAAGLVLAEGIVLMASGWKCPLTLLAESRGADHGSVADLFLPRWLAERLFPICGTVYVIALFLLLWRVLL